MLRVAAVLLLLVGVAAGAGGLEGGSHDPFGGTAPASPAPRSLIASATRSSSAAGVVAADAARATSAALDEMLARARAVYLEEGPRIALPRFEQVLALYREAGDRRGEAITLGYIGNCHKRFGDYPRALELLGRALAIKREIGDRLEEGKTESHLGLVYWNMGEYARAIERFEAAIAIGREVGDSQLEGSALNNLSLVYDEQGEYRRSLDGYERVLALYRTIDFPRGEGDTLGNIGGVHLLLGEYREALGYFRQALAISEAEGLKPAMAADLNNIARSELALGDPEAALATLDRALALTREIGLAKEEAVTLEGRAAALAHLGRYDAARASYGQAIATYEGAGLDRELIDALSQLGNLHGLLGDLASADRSFQRGLELARTIGHPLGVTFHLIALGDLERRRDRLERAGALYAQALERARADGLRAHESESLLRLALVERERGELDPASAHAREALGTAREIEGRAREAGALLALGEIERDRGRLAEALELNARAARIVATAGGAELSWRVPYGRGATLEAMGRKTEAVDAYRAAATALETIRGQLREERFRSGYLGDKYEVYVALVRLLIELGRPAEAFHYSEKLRARSYARLFQTRGPLIRTPEERRREAELRERIRQLERVLEAERARPAREQRRSAVDLFSAELSAAERAYQAFLDDLRASAPAASAAIAQAVPPIEAVQAALAVDAALVEYVVDAAGVLILVVTAETVHAARVEVPRADLEAAVELLRGLLLRPASAAWRQPALRLRRQLIEPIESAGWLEGIARLYLVPHDLLHYLPFAALAAPVGAPGHGREAPSGGGRGANLDRDRQGMAEGDRGHPTGVRLLVEEFVLVSLPSAALLESDAESRPRPSSLLAMAPRRGGLVHTEEEVRSLSGHFPEPTAIVVGRRATESRFVSEAGRHSVLHLATHGYFNKLSPLFSGLELEPDAAADGRLEVHEILDLELDARRVTLSASDTALGGGYFTEAPVGDDFVGLTRAFLFAGADAVVASLWKVDDRSTRELMRLFYSGLDRADTAAALAGAQRRMLRGPLNHAHPFYWAPFVVVGAAE